VRVVGGEARGRPLRAPRHAGLRPTSDRVKEAIFDLLEARDLVAGRDVLDLFAGSGALGIEALSRGAASCTFVDSDPRALAAIEQNLAAVGFAGRSGVTLVRSDAAVWLAGSGREVGLALVDPPYRFSEWGGLLASLRAGYAVLEHAAGTEPELGGTGYETIRRYRYGGTLVTLVAQHPTDKDAP
jgi:16S rRNA (guanine966-N2)-methyltransferase